MVGLTKFVKKLPKKFMKREFFSSQVGPWRSEKKTNKKHIWFGKFADANFVTLLLFISSWELKLTYPTLGSQKDRNSSSTRPFERGYVDRSQPGYQYGAPVAELRQDGVNGLWTEKEMTVEAVIEEAGQTVFSTFVKRMRESEIFLQYVIWAHYNLRFWRNWDT